MADPLVMERYLIPDDLRAAVEAAVARAVGDGWARRIWERDASVWTTRPAVAAKIAGRLGWLAAPEHFRGRTFELADFATAIRADGFDRALVCGMGGSSLAPEVLAAVYGTVGQGIPVGVLDSTDPAAVTAAETSYEIATSLYVIASKSGTTTETLRFLDHLWALETAFHHDLTDKSEADHFVAISDPDAAIAAIPHSDEFREVFLNPPDIGGRYSALSYVGLVPAALLGIDLEALLGEASRMATACWGEDAANPGIVLGTALGALATAGRDKLTFVLEPGLAAFGAWLEQLIAESTGKDGRGIVPVVGETLARPMMYGNDRAFVRISREDAGAWRAETDAAIDALAEAGQPVIDLVIPVGEGLGGEFFRWEFAIAVAGAAIGVNPFDEPNVAESKENTRRVLDEFLDQGRLPTEAALAAGSAGSEIGALIAGATSRDYLAIQAYIGPTPERDARLGDIRERLRQRSRLATTVGYGPRFLHSTGQLHKGGPASGRFIQLVAGHPADVAIPGHAETFGTLIDAQAIGDLRALRAHGLPVVRIDLGADPDAGLDALLASL
ncbi:MAG: glucose-6-phosphate isomerase [Candidatus Limnocylindrales bacterium]